MCSKIGRPILGIYSLNRAQIHECGNWETGHYNSVLEIMRLGINLYWNQTFILSWNF
jgi:hypothetical protein